MSKFETGQRVRTAEDQGSSDWTSEAVEDRKWGVVGRIVDHSNSHGLCYKVEHEDGTTGWYEPGELDLNG